MLIFPSIMYYHCIALLFLYEKYVVRFSFGRYPRKYMSAAKPSDHVPSKEVKVEVYSGCVFFILWP